MAVKTEFTRDDFVSVLSSYGLGAYVRPQPIQQGTVQTNYSVYTANGQDG